MNAQLVKIDVAAADLGKSVTQLFEMAEGGSLIERGLAWVFNLANAIDGDRRDLRFWRPELLARASADSSKVSRFSNYELDWVIARILPEKRQNFHAGEVDQIFQIRPRTRIDFGAELAGDLRGGRNFYSRAVLAAFLKRRWLGACYSRRVTRTNDLLPDKAAPLHAATASPLSARSQTVSRVGNSRSTGSPAKPLVTTLP